MPTYTVKQIKEMHDQNPTKSDPKDALLIARRTSEGKYVKAQVKAKMLAKV